MNESQSQNLFGTADPDPGCESSGELMDVYCEARVRGEAVSEKFASFLTHIANCTACREDTESLLAWLQEQGETSKG